MTKREPISREPNSQRCRRSFDECIVQCSRMHIIITVLQYVLSFTDTEYLANLLFAINNIVRQITTFNINITGVVV